MFDTRGTPKPDKTHPCPLLPDTRTVSVIRSLLVQNLPLSLADLVPLFSKPIAVCFPCRDEAQYPFSVPSLRSRQSRPSESSIQKSQHKRGRRNETDQ